MGGFYLAPGRTAAFACNGEALWAQFCVFLAKRFLVRKIPDKTFFSDSSWQLAGGRWQVAIYSKKHMHQALTI